MTEGRISDFLDNGVRVVVPQGSLDPESGPVLEQRCVELIESGDRRLLLDLSGVDFVSSAGLRGLVMVVKKLQAVGGQLVFCGLRPIVSRVFEVSGFSTFLRIEADRDKASEALHAALAVPADSVN